jgi:6-phospho-beta-glucosidase
MGEAVEQKKLKIVTIGGGSTYTPELIEGFIKRYDELPVSEMWLVDVEEGQEKLEIVGRLAQRMWDATPWKVKVHLTLDRQQALKDADFVTTQFRVGLLEARIKDERIPFSYGLLGQETNGAGGIFKALRTIPLILEIVNEMAALCPNAWLINFTNPSGMGHRGYPSLQQLAAGYRPVQRAGQRDDERAGNHQRRPGGAYLQIRRVKPFPLASRS